MKIVRLLLFVSIVVGGFSFAQTAPSTNPPGAFADVDGSRLYYEECGSGPKAVILLHDGVVDSAVWDDVWPAFCKQFHTIRFDRRGYWPCLCDSAARRQRHADQGVRGHVDGASRRLHHD